MKGDHNDPKALIRESFNIEGINIEECRSIFLDWALSLPNDVDAKKIIPLLIEKYNDKKEHPMLLTLREGLITTESPIRRGGRRGRLTN